MRYNAQQAPSVTSQLLIISHSNAGHHETTRFFFTDTLDPHTFKQVVKPRLAELPGVLPGGGVRRYDNYLAVQWSVHLLLETQARDATQLRLNVEIAAIEALGEAFGWEDPVVSHWERSQSELEARGRSLRVNWQLGSL